MISPNDELVEKWESILESRRQKELNAAFVDVEDVLARKFSADPWNFKGRVFSSKKYLEKVGDGEVGDGEVGDGEVGDGEVGDGEVGDGTTGGIITPPEFLDAQEAVLIEMAQAAAAPVPPAVVIRKEMEPVQLEVEKNSADPSIENPKKRPLPETRSPLIDKKIRKSEDKVDIAGEASILVDQGNNF